MVSFGSGIGNPFSIMQRPHMRSVIGLSNRGLQGLTLLQSDAETARRLVFEMGGVRSDSCGATAYAVASVISRGPTRVIENSDRLTNSEKIHAISSKLLQGNWVAITISPDHTFVVIPIGGHQVALQQAYEGCYDLEQWNRFLGQGRLMKRYFISLLDDFQNGGEAGREAALRLFSDGGRSHQVLAEEYGNGGSIRYINYGML